MNEPYIASEFARLIVQYHDEKLALEVKGKGRLVVNANDPFEPVSISLLVPYVGQLQASPSDTPVEWLIADHIHQNSAEMLSYLTTNSENVIEANKLIVEYFGLLTNAFSLDYSYAKNSSVICEACVKRELTPTLTFLFNLFIAFGYMNTVIFMKQDTENFWRNTVSNDFAGSLANISNWGPFIDITYKPGAITARFHKSFVTYQNKQSEVRLQNILVKELDLKMNHIPKVESWTQRVRFYLKHRVHENVCLEDICEHFHQSRRTMSRLIQKEGTTFKQLYDEIRKERADELIRSDIPLKKIASLAGFNTQSSFALSFKRWFGMTPGAYRSSLK